MGFYKSPSKLLAPFGSNLKIFRLMGNRAAAVILQESEKNEICDVIHGNLNSGSPNESLNNMAR